MALPEPDDGSVWVDHRHAANAPCVQQFRDVPYGCLGRDGNHVSRHDIGGRFEPLTAVNAARC